MISKKYKNIFITGWAYIMSLAIFSLFRLFLFINEIDRINKDVAIPDILNAFFIGIRFDIVIAGYILILPYFILTLLFLFNFQRRGISATLFYFIFILFSLSFLVCAADIPYFKQFFSRFSVTAFEWFDNPMFVFKMIIEEPRYWLFILPYLVLTIIFYKLLRKIIFDTERNQHSSGLALKSAASVVFLALMLLGIRGRTDEKSPIRIGTAYFCNNPFLNQLGLNPNFTLIRSYLDSKKEENTPIALLNDSVALTHVQKYLNIHNPDPNLPLLRHETFDSTPTIKHNVILVIMESMSAAKMKRGNNTQNLTPFLDSLTHEGYYFENAYSSGIHTYNGIFSSLVSFPALFKQHPMKESAMYKYHGMASVLKKHEYTTTYFTTHDGQFDNVEGFLRENDFDKIISKKDYPSDKIKTTLGVPDDYMFEFSIPVLNQQYDLQKPFLAVYMTASDHGPYYIPEYFKPHSEKIKDQIVEYADYSLNKFIRLCSKEKWFNNTLFVFIADHGAPIHVTYDLSLDYNHVPLLFYAPEIIQEKKDFSNMAGQIDVFPSIMGVLKLPYMNNTLGINLFKNERPYIYFNADDKFGVIDSSWLLIVRNDKFTGLYKYRTADLKNYENENPEIVARMKMYAESNLQSFQYLIKSKKL